MIKNIKVSEAAIKKPKNKFVFHLKVMHGDADLYEENTVKLDSEERAIEYWNLFSFWFDCDFNKRWADEEEIMEAFKNRAKELGIEDYPEDTYLDMVGMDITTGGNYYARLEGMWLTYFDENGIEHGVEEPKKLGW